MSGNQEMEEAKVGQTLNKQMVLIICILLALTIAACGGGEKRESNEGGIARSMLMAPGGQTFEVIPEAGGIKTFGPKTYVRTFGARNIYEDIILAQPGEAYIIIKNGEEGPKSTKSKRVRNGTVSLNGTVLFSSDDFHHQVYVLEMPIILLAENYLRIELGGIPDTFISIEIIQTIKDPVYDILATNLQVNSEYCPDFIELSLRLTNIGEAEILPGLSIAFYNGHPDDGGVFIGGAASATHLLPMAHEDVLFSWFNPGAGGAVIYARADDDGSGAGIYPEVDEANNLASVGTFLCQPAASGEGSITGRLIDAVTGDPLSDVDTRLYSDESGSLGDLVASTYTDSEGEFHFSGLTEGSYIITIEPSGYIAEQRTVTVEGTEELSIQDIVFSPELGEGEIRIILTWGENPADLDSHLIAPNPDGCRFHCYYANKIIPGANLDRDDVTSYGPETITITIGFPVLIDIMCMITQIDIQTADGSLYPVLR
jgi:hypothetical protein